MVKSSLLKMLLVLIVLSLSMSVDAQYNRRASNNTSGNGTSLVEEAAKGVVNGVKGLFSKKKDKSDDKDKKKDKKEKNKKNKKEQDLSNIEALMSNNTPIAEDDDIEVIASADGSTKEQATLSALRSALEQAYGTFVSSNTQILNEELVKDEIVSIASGNIKHFEYLTETEINGKSFVTLRALVSIGRLVNYAKSKGSSAELAGATFAMNVRMESFKADNIIKALNNVNEEAFKILPYCFDFTIERLSQPSENIRTGNYDVKFDVLIRFNSNAQYFKDLDEQIRYLMGQYNMRMGKSSVSLQTHSLKEILPAIFNQFMIVDDLNEMCLIDTLEDTQISTGLKGKMYYVSSIVTPKNKNKHVKSFVGDIFCDERGHTEQIDVYTPYPKVCISVGSRGDVGRIDSRWYDDVGLIYSNITPSRPFIRIPVVFSYTLDELSKISGINIVLR